MAIRALTVTLESSTELLMDRDNITFAERLVRWQKDPANADKQVPGDDRAPAWGWLGKLHYGEADKLVGIPQGMLAACMRAAATMIPHPTAKGNKSLKEVSQASIGFTKSCFPLLVQHQGQQGWHAIDYEELYRKLEQEEDFQVHEATARHYGFRLDVRRSKPQYNRSHVRVRPMFSPWRCICEMSITDDILSDTIMEQIFRAAGSNKGIGNWRPSLSRAGAYGLFKVEVGRTVERTT